MSEGFHAEVVVRWSDMDAFQHINHARMVTLLEEARIPWLFEDSRPTVTLRDGGAVIADLHVRYRGQLRHDDSPLDVFMWVEKVRAVDFTIAYEVRPPRCGSQCPAVHRGVDSDRGLRYRHSTFASPQRARARVLGELATCMNVY